MRMIVEHDGNDIADIRWCSGLYLAAIVSALKDIAEARECPLSDLNVRFIDE